MPACHFIRQRQHPATTYLSYVDVCSIPRAGSVHDSLAVRGNGRVDFQTPGSCYLMSFPQDQEGVIPTGDPP